jgi:hypothetical protein
MDISWRQLLVDEIREAGGIIERDELLARWRRHVPPGHAARIASRGGDRVGPFDPIDLGERRLFTETLGNAVHAGVIAADSGTLTVVGETMQDVRRKTKRAVLGAVGLAARSGIRAEEIHVGVATVTVRRALAYYYETGDLVRAKERRAEDRGGYSYRWWTAAYADIAERMTRETTPV